MNKRFDIACFALALTWLSAMDAQAQNEVNSPYSEFGIGLVNRSSCCVLDAMGGVSYAMQSPYCINFMNPASYAAFDSLSFIADASASVHSVRLSSEEATLRNSYANPNYIAIGFPVTRHWRASLGVRPYSTVGYDITDRQEDGPAGTASFLYQGNGGVNQLYFGNAFKICKGLSIGLNASYMFGTINKTRFAEFDGAHFYNTRIRNIFTVNGLYLTGGIQYFLDVKDGHRLGFGLTYGNTARIQIGEKLLTDYYQNPACPITVYDTVFYDENKKGLLKIPQKVGFGLSYVHKERLCAAADVSWQNWDRYGFMGHGDSLHDALSAALGLQFTPDPASGKFFRRMRLRAGIRYATGETVLHNTRIAETGVTLGIGIPLTSFSTHSSMNFNLEFGRTGTLKNGLLRQNYFKFTFGFILQEKWYQKIKIE